MLTVAFQTGAVAEVATTLQADPSHPKAALLQAEGVLLEKGPEVLKSDYLASSQVASTEATAVWGWLQRAAAFVSTEVPIALARTWAFLVGVEHNAEVWYASPEVQGAIEGGKDNLVAAAIATQQAAEVTTTAVSSKVHDAQEAAAAAYASPDAVAFREGLAQREHMLQDQMRHGADALAAGAQHTLEEKMQTIANNEPPPAAQ